MNIIVLSKGPQLYSTQSLLRAARRRGHSIQVVDYGRCNLVLEKGRPEVHIDSRKLQFADAIIPRIGASGTALGAAVINQFEAMKVATTIRADTLLEVRDKLRCLQKLARCGINIPKTITAVPNQNSIQIAQQLGGFPIVVKLMASTHGAGVFLVESHQSLNSTVDAFAQLKERVLLQEFIKEAKGADIRALVVAGEVVAAMERKAKPGEFRSNLHRGATADPITLNDEEEELVKKVAKVVGLEVAGIDLLRSSRGPLVIEVNASPGLEGIETTTRVDVAGKIIQLLETKARVLDSIQSK